MLCHYQARLKALSESFRQTFAARTRIAEFKWTDVASNVSTYFPNLDNESADEVVDKHREKLLEQLQSSFKDEVMGIP